MFILYYTIYYTVLYHTILTYVIQYAILQYTIAYYQDPHVYIFGLWGQHPSPGLNPRSLKASLLAAAIALPTAIKGDRSLPQPSVVPVHPCIKCMCILCISV